MEAFSDGVIAIIITIMVIELHPPHGHTLADLGPIVPKLLYYVLSFGFLAIYWNNHHHLLHAVERVNGAVLWANVHLLFWLSLVPFVTAWIGENSRAATPVAAYGAVLLASAIAYFILTRALLAVHEKDSRLSVALGRDWKGKLSVVAYIAGMTLAFVWSPLAIALYIGVAIVWLIPDKRIERALGADDR